MVDYNGGRTLDDLIEYVEKRVAGIVDDDEDDSDSDAESDAELDTESDAEGEEPEIPKDEL